MSSARYCSKCGHALFENDRFCQNCGAEAGAEAKAVARVAARSIQGSSRWLIAFGLLSALSLTYFLAVGAGTVGLLVGLLVIVFLLVLFGCMWKRTKALTARI